MEDLEEKIDMFFETPTGITFASMKGVKKFIGIIKDWVKDYVSDCLKEKKQKAYHTLCYPIVYTKDNPDCEEFDKMSKEYSDNFYCLLQQGYQIQQSNLSTMKDVIYVHYVLAKEI